MLGGGCRGFYCQCVVVCVAVCGGRGIRVEGGSEGGREGGRKSDNGGHNDTEGETCMPPEHDTPIKSPAAVLV